MPAQPTSDQASAQPAAPAQAVGSLPGEAAPAKIPTPPGSASSGPTPPESVPPPSECSNGKPAAKKCAAKPPAAKPQDDPPANDSNVNKAEAAPAPEASSVKVQATPMRSIAADEAARTQAEQDNLNRANTLNQHTPASTPRGADNPYPYTYDPGEEDKDDLEAALDRDIKRERPNIHSDDEDSHGNGHSTAPPAAEQTQGTQQTPARQQPEEQEGQQPPKGRKEKTPAQKAAHARYMRFSRSFTRTLMHELMGW